MEVKAYNIKSLMNTHKGKGNWVTDPSFLLIVFLDGDNWYSLIWEPGRRPARVYKYLTKQEAYDLTFGGIMADKYKIRSAGEVNRSYTYPTFDRSKWDKDYDESVVE